MSAIAKNQYTPNLLIFWKKFMEKNVIDGTVESLIAGSWAQCREKGLDPYGLPRDLARLGENKIEIRRRREKDLLKAALPLMKLLFNFPGVFNRGIVTLADQDGYVLEVIIADQNIPEELRRNFLPGMNQKNLACGTNAIGLAMETGRLVKVTGAEHYKFYFHAYEFYASPITDSQKAIAGILAIGRPIETDLENFEGNLKAAVKIIEQALLLQAQNYEYELKKSFFDQIMEFIPQGVICLDQKEVVNEINLFAAQIFNGSPDKLIGKPVHQLNPALEAAVEPKDQLKEAGFVHKKITFKTGKGQEKHYRCGIKRFNIGRADEQGTIVFLDQETKFVGFTKDRNAVKTSFNFSDILGINKSFREAVELAHLTARTDTRVLLQGETGTGKDLFAQAIHEMSNLSNGPYVAINCGAIPRELIESELFGYEEGAFTGAKKGGKPGKFELANGGTLFLDEVDSMSMDMQAKLLRVLQEKCLTRLGGRAATPINVRVISACNADLEEEVNKSRFRADLFYRLAVMIIKIPPLRERKEDIELLTDFFIEKICLQLGIPRVIFGVEAMEALNRYYWPGNVRELENVVERAILTSQDSYVRPENLGEKIFKKKPVAGSAQKIQLMRLDDMEKEMISKTLAAMKGNMVRTAKILGISRNTLYLKVKKYKLNK